MRIKICGMTNAENMREIAALEPDFFGLIFYPKSPRFVSLERAKSLPQFENIRRVGVFVNETAENILQIAEVTNLSLIQLHGGESAQFCEELKNKNLKISKVFAIDKNFDGAVLREFERVCDYFLFDTKTPQHGGSGQAFDWTILQKCSIRKPFFLGGGIGAGNVAEAIEACQNLPLFALDLNSRAEISAGLKCFETVKKVMEQTKPKITFEENANVEDIGILGKGIADFVRSKIGGGKHTNLTFFLRDEKGEIIGGVHGNYSDFGWLYVDSLWVSESARNVGCGTRLMNSIEQEAIKCGCAKSYLSTFSFQAPEFYKKLGYTIFGELENFPAEHIRFFLTKNLI